MAVAMAEVVLVVFAINIEAGSSHLTFLTVITFLTPKCER